MASINPIQMMQLLRSKNPQQVALNMLQEESQSNPVLNNLLQMIQQGDYASVEQIARNIVNERGLDFDTEFNKFKQQYGLN